MENSNYILYYIMRITPIECWFIRRYGIASYLQTTHTERERESTIAGCKNILTSPLFHAMAYRIMEFIFWSYERCTHSTITREDAKERHQCMRNEKNGNQNENYKNILDGTKNFPFKWAAPFEHTSSFNSSSHSFYILTLCVRALVLLVST